MVTIKEMMKRPQNVLRKGNMACAGCGLSLAVRHIFAAIDKPIAVTIGACCFSVVHAGGRFKTSLGVPGLNVPFAAPDSSASGLAASYRAQGKDYCVIAFGGDGGADIGMAAISGAAARNEDIIRVVYTNQLYSNTGGQKSESTYRGQRTTTTPTGKKTRIRSLVRLMWGHSIPYIATASIGYIRDLADKITKASQIEGYKFILVDASCPTSWVADTNKTVLLGELAVKTGIFPLLEVEEGKLKFGRQTQKIIDDPTSKLPITEYTKHQGRFRGISEAEIEQLEKDIQDELNDLKKLM